jgi:hypothetical protein
MPSFMMPLQQRNKHGFHADQWKKWPDIAQRVINEVMDHMVRNQDMYRHPASDPVRDEYWYTTAHNAAWIAGDAVLNALKDIEAGRGYARKPKK